jgi:hypothetical protein
MYFDFTPVITLLAVVIVVVGLWLRRRAGMKRQAEYQAGTRCQSCNATNMQVNGDAATCLECRWSVSLSKLKASAISAKEIV